MRKEISMGLFDQLTDLLGGRAPLERFANDQAQFDDPSSPDHERWNHMVSAAPEEDVQEAMTQAARHVDSQEYYDHITPGVRGTNPLEQLGGGTLAMLARSLLGNLTHSGGFDLSRLQQLIPGLHTTDPQRMNPQEVADVANYTRQHHPDAFGRTAAQVGRQEPGVLQQLLGNKALMLAAAGLATRFLGARARR
jgi:hypothetical protein